MRTCSFNNQKYYYYYSENSSFVLSFKKERLSLKEVNSLGFSSITQMALFLDKNNLKNNSIEYYDEQKFCEVLCENLKTSEGIPLSLALAKTLFKGINFQTIKTKDYGSMLEVLTNLAVKNKLVFNKIKLDLQINLKTLDKSLRKYFSSPYGEITKNSCSLMPLLVEPMLKKIGL